jgi:tubulin polyglutamylase TTLL6/13
VQTYIADPYLLGGFKFDLRIYVLVVCCNPLRMYIFKEGLVRICTREYSQPNAGNINMPFMHLTNYSINKENPEYVQNDTEELDGAKKQRYV